mgnify:FL=1
MFETRIEATDGGAIILAGPGYDSPTFASVDEATAFCKWLADLTGLDVRHQSRAVLERRLEQFRATKSTA